VLLYTRKLLSAFEKAKAIKEHKKLYIHVQDRIPVSVEDVLWVIEDMTGISIKKYEVTTISEIAYVRGILERNQNKTARILIRSNQSDDWKRYTCVKELSHIAVDEVEDLSVFGEETIAKMIDAKTIERFSDENGNATDKGIKVPDNEIQSEEIAEIIAIEIMYPHEFRENDLAQLKVGKATIASLALYYKLPGIIIQRALGIHYRDLANKMWEKLKSN